MTKRKRKSKKKRKRWSSDEIRHLKKAFRNKSTMDVAEEMRRTFASVQAKANVLGLRKTKKYLKSIRKA